MTNSRYLKNPVSAVLSVGGIEQIDLMFLEANLPSGLVGPISVRPSNRQDNNLRDLIRISERAYSVSLNYTRTCNEINSSSTSQNALALAMATKDLNRHLLFEEPFSTQEALVEETLNTTDKYFASVWRGRLADAVVDAPRRILPQYVSIDDTLRIVDGKGTTVSLVSVAPSHDCLCRDLNHILWTWIDSSLPKDARRAIRAYISHWLGTKSGLVQGTIHLDNIASQRFAKAAGFELTCLHIRRK